MVPKSFEQAFEQVNGLARRFADNEAAYLSPRYQEAEVRQDFLDKFFVALGWDVYHQDHPNPYEREVRIEKTVHVENRGKRADYAFYTAPNYMQARFMAEAKKPSRQLENPSDCFQAMRYGWNSNTPLAVLTDFEQFLILDSRYKPSVDKAMNGIIEKFHYSDFTDEEAFRKIYYLFSREAVGDNSLEKFITGLKKSRSAKAAKIAPVVQIQPVGDTFLAELDVHREALARSFKRSRAELEGDELTEITQRTLDRLVFIRFLEDKFVEPSEIVDRWGKKSGNAWRDFAGEIPRLNSIYNGIIFKPHSILDAPDFEPEGKAFDETIAWLSHRNSAYDFNTIPIHILGSIYERFLGKTITVTDHRARVEEKPEVRKAGGVYYTPEYIVSYIVENTIGKLIEGKSPDEIAKMRFADIACGSGSFLLGIFDYLIKYYVDWYSTGSPPYAAESTGGFITPERGVADASSDGVVLSTKIENHPPATAVPLLRKEGSFKKRRSDAIKAGLVRETPDGNLQLTLEHKRDILLNNIYGVDLDAQAVEVAQLSLYLKLLEEETAATVQPKLGGLREQLLPSLNKNIVHGNSLIDFDIMDTPLFKSSPPYEGGVDAALGGRGGSLRKLNPMSFQNTFPEVFANGGFDAIVGNPPYVRMESFKPLKVYLKRKFASHDERSDLYSYFIEQANRLLNANGRYGVIVSNKFLRANYGKPLRDFLAKNTNVEQVIDFAGLPVFAGATVRTIILITTPKAEKDFATLYAPPLPVEGFRVLHGGAISVEDAIADSIYEVPSSILHKEIWNFGGSEASDFLDNLKSRYTSLKDYADGKICMGVKSGLTEAFVIDAHKKAEIISENPEAIEIVKPFINGRDVRRYSIEEKNQYLIYTFHGVDLTKYPAIEEHLRPFKEKLEKRATRQNWYELQQPQLKFAKYMDGPKIIFPDISTISRFALDVYGHYGSNTIYFIPRNDLYLLGLLNSKLGFFYFVQTCAGLEGTGETYLRFFGQYLEGFPVRTIDFNKPAEKAMHDRTVELVDKMIDAKKNVASARTDRDREFYERLCENLDHQIDELVYQLYDITPEERKIIEGN